MLSYIMFSIVMFAVFVLLCVLGVMIYSGKTNLIHDYHQTWVKDKIAYGKAFGRALCGMGGAFLISGIIPLAGHSDKSIILAIIVLVVILLVSGFFMIMVQKKYNCKRG